MTEQYEWAVPGITVEYDTWDGTGRHAATITRRETLHTNPTTDGPAEAYLWGIEVRITESGDPTVKVGTTETLTVERMASRHIVQTGGAPIPAPVRDTRSLRERLGLD